MAASLKFDLRSSGFNRNDRKVHGGIYFHFPFYRPQVLFIAAVRAEISCWMIGRWLRKTPKLPALSTFLITSSMMYQEN
jgi:hypothetical protein